MISRALFSLVNPQVLLWGVWLSCLALFYSLARYEADPARTVVMPYILGSLALFSCAYLLGGLVSRLIPVPEEPGPVEVHNGWVTLLAILGLAGGIMFILDLVVYRGVDLSEGLGAVRYLRAETVSRVSPLSIFGRIFLGFGPIVGMIWILRYEAIAAPLRTLCALVVLLAMLCGVLEGGRTTPAITLAMIFAATRIRQLEGLGPMPGRALAFQLLKYASIPAALIVFSYIFVSRRAFLYETQEYALELIEQVYLVTFSQSFRQLSPDLTTVVAGFYVYLTHSISELTMLVTIEKSPFWWGRENFHLFFYFFEKIGLLDPTDAPEPLLRGGVYYSALGDLYIDFGMLGTLAIVSLLGLLTGWLWIQAQRRHALAVDLPLAFMLVAILASPLASLTVIGNGFSVMLAMLLSPLLYGMVRLMPQGVVDQGSKASALKS